MVTFVPENRDYRYTAHDLRVFFADHRVDNLLLINPDNPSGNFIPVDDVLSLAAWCQNHNIRLIVDEIFVVFTYDLETFTLLRNRIL